MKLMQRVRKANYLLCCGRNKLLREVQCVELRPYTVSHMCNSVRVIHGTLD